MMTVPFTVNNREVRRNFLRQGMMEALCSLTGQAVPLWGRFTAQHMVEHLLWTFKFSTGDLNIHRDVPPPVAERMRKFLYDDRPTPREFKNPLLSEIPPPLTFASLVESKSALQRGVNRFFDVYEKSPTATYDHPLFGPLDGEEWERALFKHCYHHLMQFGLLEEGERNIEKNRE
ncbi:DUF1569 domain-containing protein [bacterium]|nr:MAG: DUF1569 domain-containing protein [bacterium]